MRCRILLFALLLSSFPLPLNGAEKNGEWLLTNGKAILRWMDSGYKESKSIADDGVLSYIRGYRDALTWAGQTSKNSPVSIPVEVTSGQLVRVVVSYLEKHPEELHQHTSVLLWNAFVQAYPNPNFKPPKE